MTVTLESINDLLKRNIEDQNKIFADFKSLNDKVESLSRKGQSDQESANNRDAANQDIQELRRQEQKFISQIRVLEEEILKIKRPDYSGNTDSSVARNFGQTFCKLLATSSHAALSEAERSVLYPNLTLADIEERLEKRTQSNDFENKGGILAPISFEREIIRAILDDSVIRTLATVSNTTTRASEIKKVDRPTVGWVYEETKVTKSTRNLGKQLIKIWQMRGSHQISQENFEDADFNWISEMAQSFGEEMALYEEAAFALGDGIGKPEGIFVNKDRQAGSNFQKSGVAAALTDANNNGFDALIRLEAKVKGTVRKRSSYIMNSNTEIVLRTVKDLQGRYIWASNSIEGKPATINGYPVHICEYAPDIAANTFPIAYGDWKKAYLIKDRVGMIMQRLDELYAEEGNIGFIVRKRVGADVVQPEAYALLKISA